MKSSPLFCSFHDPFHLKSSKILLSLTKGPIIFLRRNFEKIAENFMKMKEFWEFQDAIPPPSPVPPVEKKHYRVYRVYNV